jgi:hypothetical protein
MIKLLLMLPYNLAKIGFNYFSKKITFTYSGMPAPREGFNWYGVKTKSFIVFMPAIGEQLCGILAIACNNIIQVSLITDIHYIEYPDEFMEILNRRFNQFIY